MNASALGALHATISGLVPVTADFYGADRHPPLDVHLENGRTWVKLYSPSEQGENAPREDYLVTIDCGNRNLEAARAVAEAIREGLKGSPRTPSPFRRLRIVALDEETFHRMQLSYRWRITRDINEGA